MVNLRSFAGLGALRGRWEVTADGAVVARGTLPRLDAAPGEAQAVRIEAPDVPGERFATFRFFLRRAADWAPAGHEVAWQQLPLPGRAARPSLRRARRLPRVDADGRLAELGDFLLDGPRLQLWRAATDNDGLRLLPERNGGPLRHWLVLGIDRLEPRLEEDGAVVVVHRSDLVVHRQSFRLLADGGVHVENDVELAPELRDLPRVGVVLTLAPGLERLEWHGRGPWEDYVDRRAPTTVARWTSTVSEQYVPYILPQEHGHHTDARRIALRGDDGRGVEVRALPTIGFGASHYTAADLFAARHTSDLVPRPEVILSLDHAQRGLGTASCGPDTGERYRLLDGEYRFGYVLRALG